MQLYTPSAGGSFLGPARYPGLSHPGTRVVEIRGNELRSMRLQQGELLNIIDLEGGGPVLLNATDEADRSAIGSLGLNRTAADVAASAPQHWQDWHEWLQQRRVPAKTVPWVQLFSESASGPETLTLQCSADCTLWLGNAAPLALTGLSGGTLRVEIHGGNSDRTTLPDPVGHVIDEFRIDRATAGAYQVKAGDYLEIIDVEGRQCSDFLAFRQDALERGVERFIDSTVTRSMVGRAYPAPGLSDKYFDQDMRPLVSVVRDTVGRHDTFALACTARGYEERGFPGHVNCSDNISHAMNPFGVEARAAWPAINLFFNSWILPSDNRLSSDEAWSRPGDHVIMKALTDLVCVSTACPDDIDPINGWNPTDIHVRIYSAKRPISHAIAHRPLPHNEPVMTEQSAFHEATSRLTSNYQVARDVWLPVNYDASRTLGEYWACREAVTVQDMSSLRKYDIAGPDAERFLQRVMSRDVSRLAANRCQYALILSDDGSVLDDGTLYRVAPGVFRWCCGSEHSAEHMKEMASQWQMKVWVRSLWSTMPSLAIQGPKSRELLKELVFTQPHQPALDNLKWFGFTVARLHDRDGPAFLLSRTGFTGELGYELFCDRADAMSIWDAVMENAEAFGLTPMGSEALELLRVEAGLMSAGHEFGPQIDAFESGLDFAVDMKKDDFIGKAALQRNLAATRQTLVGLIFEGDEVPAHGDPVFQQLRQIGVITSAIHSPQRQCAIAMARVAVEHASEGTRLECGRLDGQMKRLPAVVTGIPFFDPTRSRARA
ncbi:DUF1989 domain-containing protein [Granulosicoccus sp. 3-233]|uniref:DUF1989 domain-containing protein n=1 Tax=Granulosicoccus sp. 3-233 TaxID=3417969 RepID=UPI003D32769D